MRMARPLTLTRRVLTAPGRRRDRYGKAQVGPGNTQGPGRTRPLNAIDRRQSEQVSVNGHGWTAWVARPLECRCIIKFSLRFSTFFSQLAHTFFPNPSHIFSIFYV